MHNCLAETVGKVKRIDYYVLTVLVSPTKSASMIAVLCANESSFRRFQTVTKACIQNIAVDSCKHQKPIRFEAAVEESRLRVPTFVVDEDRILLSG